MRELAAHTVDVDVVIRDPRSTLQQALAGMAAVFVVIVARIWLGPIDLSPGLLAVAGLFTIIAVGASLFRLPVWVRVGRGGVAFRAWWRSGCFAWSEIESFEVGNPAEPRFAYVVTRSAAGTRPQAVRAPEFRTISPTELVRQLQAKQRAFVGSR